MNQHALQTVIRVATYHAKDEEPSHSFDYTRRQCVCKLESCETDHGSPDA